MSNPAPADLVIQAAHILSMDGSQAILSDHAVIIQGDTIAAIMPTNKWQTEWLTKEVIDLGQHVLMPGLINAHTHAAMTLLRGYADDLALMEWLSDHIWPAEGRHVDEHFVQVGTDLAIAEMIRGGTTCFNDMYFYPDTVAERAVAAGIRANVGMIVLEMPTRWAENSAQYLEKGLKLHDELRHQTLVRTSFAPHAPYTVEDVSLQHIQTLSDELDVQIHIHVHETADEIEQSISRFGMRPLERLAKLGLTTPRLQAVHMTQLLSEEIKFCAEQGVHVIHCPQSNMKLASGNCPVTELLEHGINVALGTDGAASNNDLDMIEETRTAALLAKSVSENPTSLPAWQALEMATINGARAMGIDDITGSIEPGKQADLIAIDMMQPRTQPLFNPVTQVAYSAAADQVSDVWIAGKQVLQGNRHTSLDLEQILSSAEQWRQIIMSPNSN
ncbi:MAG: 5-methylthioadenosine/S-adenosylhomocysteine deaminase [Parasphingorhabdus sp.]|jgi:5-methylthioadenosine/S-adenosylhomocysteine deaminase